MNIEQHVNELQRLVQLRRDVTSFTTDRTLEEYKDLELAAEVLLKNLRSIVRAKESSRCEIQHYPSLH